ncbi:hypothetical protein GO495_02975 [Chitinophaga oryziterrae]|uniref:YD repeat-containing protein n=1 Tax=Chitinophaga oryziterrae TaxID=1031224 RepID=A0A6N8J4E0_9BACT|nr:hypothetical protein [Chitinophaga oryziterrae]MVT39538.1 hypothetical protein [Chitinophaga oryziterrae]
MKTFGLMVFNILIIAIYSYGQKGDDGTPNNIVVVPPTPDVAKIAEYGDIQSNLFNGVPNIGIPIYTISVDNFSLPISLKYNASGFKVDEMSSAVGLGWSLFAGGNIAISVRGRSDNLANRYVLANYNDFSPDDQTLPTGGGRSDYEWAKFMIDNNYDTEQDIYYYTVGDYSGKFFMNNDLTRIIQVPYSNLKITKQNGYRIRDTKGVEYVFADPETISTTQRCSVGVSNLRGSSTNNITGSSLSQITTANGRKINFSYESIDLKYPVGMDETRYVSPASQPSGQCSLLDSKDRLCQMISLSQQRRLKTITFDDSSLVINFNYDITTREDIALDNIRYGNRLKSIEVYCNSVLQKRFTLSHDYFRTQAYNTTQSIDDQSLNSRLKLTSVSEEGVGSYVFNYNERELLPARLSFAQDLWGYYNQKNANTSLIPKELYPDGRGANRTSISNFKTAFLLEKMMYPTGGSTSFRYEPHTDSQFVQHTAAVTKTLYLGYTGTGLGRSFRDTVVLSGISRNCTISYYVSESSTDRSTGSIQYPDGTILSLTTPGFNSLSRALNNGTYIIAINNTNANVVKSIGISSTVDSTYNTKEVVIVGGVRIAKMTDISTTGAEKSTFYDYNIPNTTKSSITYTHKSPGLINSFYTRTASASSFTECSYNVLSSSSYPDLGTDLNENPIGYQYVTVKKDSLGLVGRKKYKFSIKPSDLIGDISVPGTPEWCRGKQIESITEQYNPATTSWIVVEKEQAVYKTNFHPQAMLTPGYPQEHEELVPNFRLRYLKTELSNAGLTFPAEFIYETFECKSTWVRLDQQKKFYYGGNNQTLIDSVQYSYANLDHVQPTTIASLDSKGRLIQLLRKYPQDFAGTPVYDTMVSRNILPIIQEDQYRSNQFVKNDKTNYLLFGQLPLPSSVEEKSGTSNSIIKTTYQKYDTFGNLQQLVKANGVVESYIWGYKNKYPIAKVVGVNYADAISYLNTNLVNSALPSDQTIKDEVTKVRNGLVGRGFVNTYTFIPWIGMTTSVNSKGRALYYLFDSQGRLKVVKDNDGKILKFYDYQYQVPVNQ